MTNGMATRANGGEEEAEHSAVVVKAGPLSLLARARDSVRTHSSSPTNVLPADVGAEITTLWLSL